MAGKNENLPIWLIIPHLSLAGYLVLVQLTVFVLLLSLLLESDDNKTNKDVHHEEGNDDDVDDEEYGDAHSIVVHGT